MDFCSASLERDWALIVGTFHFRFGAPWLKKPRRLLLHKLHAWGFRSDNHRWKNQMPTPSVSCTLDFQCKLCLIAKTYHRYALKTTNQGVYHKVWGCTEFARLLHKIRFFFLGQMNVLLWTPSKSTYIYVCTYLIGWCKFVSTTFWTLRTYSMFPIKRTVFFSTVAVHKNMVRLIGNIE